MLKQLKGITGLAALVALTACGGEGEEENGQEANGNDGQEESNEQSGELTIYSSGPGGMAEELAEAFEEESGIEVDLFQSTTGDVLGRLEGEASNPIADVVALASMPPAMEYKQEGLTYEYESEYAGSMREGWYDEDHHFYGFSAAALGLSYNTDMVDEAPADWDGLLDSEYEDQIAIPDPQESGTARDFVSAFIQQEGDDGWELFEDLTANGLQMEGANTPALESVISGANTFVMAGVDYMVYNNIEDGEPVDIAFPESGTTITPRPAFILESSENKPEAEAYIDFILSDEGQEIVADAYLMPGREDVPAHEDRAQPEDIEMLDFDWEFLDENGQDILEEFLEVVR
ncbi:ABC transporter substrate-binding protein [Salisediminibacterium halotolerans]|uniref:Iron(III) transport system substrate-binding protein n=1 Tax=Salisediminibacterium halotolerans TaxID=517425 RepID=A0A1H9VJR4_9BACI|nr:ABC transporter substrate-binding protein [Salisediminibacterium haloalkalitolerans]SES21809.1 iron(III) transport system substrate-binding protein [Salisediminibacterium haloalkalitolerans]